jgi:hypothetical protein
MKAIQTKFLGATSTKPSRIKASAEGVPSKTYSKESLWKPYGGSGEVVNYHIEAAKRFAVENEWPINLASGGLPDPDVWVHCFLPKEAQAASGTLQLHVTGKIHEASVAAANRFTVVAVSSNTNSFGYKSIILLNESGEGWEILKSAYGCEDLPKQGDVVNRVGDRFQCGSYQCPRRLEDAAPKVAAKILKEVKGA